MDHIRIRGARTHNLRNVNLDIPRERLVVITGLSGSGKSSLAFDTLYAEGQRRYVESLSAYARQFLQLMEKPDVDLIEGLSPAISIEQKATSHNPRSTVGTVTEIHDYLRLLFARVGEPHCPEHGLALSSQSVSQMVDHVLALPEGTRVMVLAPLVIARKGEQAELFEELRSQGFVRLRINGEVHEIDRLPKLERNRKHTVEIVVDRLKVQADAKQRLAESFETALRHADGRALAVEMDAGPRAPVLREVRLPPVQLLAAGARAPALLLQQPDGRLPAVRRAGTGHLLRPQARGRLPAPVARRGRHPGLGPAQPVLLLDARLARPALRLRRRDALRGAPRARAGRGPGRLGRGEDRLPLPGRARPLRREGARLRGNPAEPRAPLPRDRFRRREGGARQVPQQPRLPGLRRRAAAPGGAPRPRRRPLDRGRLGDAPQGRAALLRDPAASGQPPGHRRQDPARDRQPDPVPERRGPRLPLAHALGRHALRRRGAAHPPREPDRLRPHRRDVRARRALHRAAPARQRAAHRHAQAPARPRQLRDRGRARRGGDPRGRPRGGHGARRRRARRRGRRAGHADRDRAQPRLADRTVPVRAQVDRRAGAAPPARGRDAACASSGRAATTSRT